MPNVTFIMDLAKLLIAAAWVDGELSNEEINALKDLLFSLPDISGEEWKHLEIYMDSPVTSKERDDILSRVSTGITSNKDKDLVVDTLTRLFEADGNVSDEEHKLLQEIKDTLSKTPTGIFSRMSKIGRLPGASHNPRHNTPNRQPRFIGVIDTGTDRYSTS